MATPVLDKPLVTKPLAARYDGDCAICEERYPAGEPIIATPYGWAHSVCPEPKPLGAVCTGCFTEIASNGECLC